MAVYFLRTKHISRNKGARVTRAVAYRAGERITDERTGEVHNYSNRRDVAHKEVVLPEDLAGRDDMAWTQDRSRLWNAAEHAGRPRHERTCPESPRRVTIAPLSNRANEPRNRCATHLSVRPARRALGGRSPRRPLGRVLEALVRRRRRCPHGGASQEDVYLRSEVI